jgi:hypothetical protein
VRASEQAASLTFVRHLPQHLSVAWLAVALLYLLDIGTLPEPVLAFVIGTAVAIGMSASRAVPAGAGHSLRAEEPSARAVRTDAARGLPEAAWAPAPEAVKAEPAVIDPSVYRQASPTEIQCPRCGGFAVSLLADPDSDPDSDPDADPDPDPDLDAGNAVRCQVCGNEWSWDQQRMPDVTIRSWLHR